MLVFIFLRDIPHTYVNNYCYIKFIEHCNIEFTNIIKRMSGVNLYQISQFAFSSTNIVLVY